MADWAIEPLADHHDRAGFHCGKPPLDDWIRRSVGQYQRRDLARAYVLVRPGQPRVHGYYAISNRHIDFAHLPPSRVKKLPRSLPLPAVLIGQLAVDQGVQGQGLGDVLLADALRRVLALAAGRNPRRDRRRNRRAGPRVLSSPRLRAIPRRSVPPVLDDPRPAAGGVEAPSRINEWKHKIYISLFYIFSTTRTPQGVPGDHVPSKPRRTWLITPERPRRFLIGMDGGTSGSPRK